MHIFRSSTSSRKAVVSFRADVLVFLRPKSQSSSLSLMPCLGYSTLLWQTQQKEAETGPIFYYFFLMVNSNNNQQALREEKWCSIAPREPCEHWNKEELINVTVRFFGWDSCRIWFHNPLSLVNNKTSVNTQYSNRKLFLVGFHGTK